MFGSWGTGMMGYFSWGGMVLGFLLLVFLIGSVALAVRYLPGFFGQGPAPETPLEILKRRYAKGEITTEEFELMKNNLRLS